ncbi:alpha/beta-hydrolase [Hypoxylon cercidicola]|nr:alpha/beta-hydrolase [Hypoxylon cercidicola]
MVAAVRFGILFLAQTLWSLSARALPNPIPVPEDADSPDLSNTSIPDALRLDELYGAPDNDFNCKSERNPVVLLHGLSADREVDLNMLQWELKRRGYCTFSLTYGAWDLVPWIGGLREMADSAKDIADFVREVKDKTGAEKVDIVGHSEGGVQAIYVPMTQDGISDIVERLVALGPAIHGAEYLGVTDLWYIGGEATRSIAKLVQRLLGCPACDNMMTGGTVYHDFKNAEKIVQPGNKATIIMSSSDILVKPDVSRIDEPGVNNVIVQDTCPDDVVGHAGLMWDKSVWRLVVNALEENNDAVFPCEIGMAV